MTDFFQEFKEQRKQHSITLEEISARTKINLRFLEAIEEGEFDVLPETYMRLFLRAYALELGIDPDEAIEKLELYLGTVPESHHKPDKPQKKIKEFSETSQSPGTTPQIDLKPKNTFNWKRSVILIVVFGFILWAVKSYVGNDTVQRPTSSPKPKAAASDTVQPTKAGTHTDTAGQSTQTPTITDEQFEQGQVVEQTQQAISSVNQSKPIVLRFEAVDRTWVRVTRDTMNSEEYIFLPQDEKTWRANNQIELRIGNSAGARLTLNGEQIGSLGAPNTVTNLVINRNGILNKKTVVPTAVATSRDTIS